MDLFSISHYCTFLAMSSPACAEDRAVECQESGREKDRQGSGQTGPAPSRMTDHRAEDRGPGQGLQTGEVGKPRTFHRGSEGSGGLEPLPSAVWASRPRTTYLLRAPNSGPGQRSEGGVGAAPGGLLRASPAAVFLVSLLLSVIFQVEKLYLEPVILLIVLSYPLLFSPLNVSH